MQRVALALSQVIPSPALGLLLDANLSSVHIHEGLDSVTALVAGKVCGAKYVVDAVNCCKSLLRDMAIRGVAHGERARGLDVNCFLRNRDTVAQSNCAQDSACSTILEPRPLRSAPQARPRDK